MDRAKVLAEIERFRADLPIEQAWMPPSSWYTDPSVHELELQAVFGRNWQPVVRASEVAEPGSYASGCTAGEPWVVVRDESGTLRAFYNACRHKGREVVQGSGRADALVCGYHAWTYSLDGRLKSAPRMGGIQNFDREDMSLVALRTEVWGQWVFVNGDPDAAPLAEQVGELTARLERGGWEKLRFVDRRTWTLACNWKVYVDNYLDGGYHIPHMHPSLDAQLDMASYRTDVFERFSIQSSGSAGGRHERIGEEAIYAWIYPNFMLNRYGSCLDTNYVLPLGHDRCQVLYEFYFLETEGEQARRFIEQSMDQAAVTQREDISICESVQIGLGSRSYDRGRYAPRVETGEHHFHRLLSSDLRRGCAAGAGVSPVRSERTPS